MCNLSQGIEEKGIEIGRAEGEAKVKQIILNLYKQGFTAEQIAAIADKNIEEVKVIVAGNEPVMI